MHRRQSHIVRAFSASLLISGAGMLPVLLLGAHAPGISAAFGFGDEAIGILVGVFFGLAGVLAVPAGNWSERVGWERGIVAAAVLAMGALLVAAAAPGPWPFVLGLIVPGSLAFTLSVPASSLSLATEVPARLHGTLFGFRQASVPLAGLGAGLSVTYVSALGWRAPFAVAALIPFVAALAVPRRAGHPPRTRTRKDRPGRSDIPNHTALLLLTVGGGLATVAGPSLTAFLVLDLIDRGFEVERAGLVLALASACGLGVRVVVGWAIDRLRSSGLPPLLLLVGLGCVGFLGLALGPPALTVVSAVVAYAAGWGWSGVYYFVLAAHFPTATGRATGAAQVGVTAGAALGPFAFGAIAGAVGYRMAWGGLAAAVLAGLGLLVFAARALNRPQGVTATT